MNTSLTQTNLIPLWTLAIGSEPQTTVSARDLHEFLECKTKFSDWISRRLSEYGFLQDVDFTVILNNEKNQEGRPKQEYYLTLDTAKELAMVERNTRGKEARQYFLACEKALQEKLKAMSPAEVLIHQGQLLLAVEHEQARQAEVQRQMTLRQEAVEQRQEASERRLDQIETAVDHFTIIGWHRYAKLGGSLPLPDAAKMGKTAAQFCKDHEVPMGEVPDPRFGTVKTYPKWVLDELFLGQAN